MTFFRSFFEVWKFDGSMKMKCLELLTVLFVSLLWAVWAEEEVGFPQDEFQTSITYADSYGENVSTQSNEHHRIRRDWESNCEIPQRLENAAIKCTSYPSQVRCTHSCVAGHKLSRGLQREMWCNYNLGEWKPKPYFEKCLPFVDCTVRLTSAGDMSCSSSSTRGLPVCSISCARNAGRPRVPMRKYRCLISGGWEPRLPHCAESKGISLVSPPVGPGPQWF